MAESLEPTTKERLKHILAKDINDLTDYDKLFLRARVSYIGQREKDKFASVLTESRSERKAREAREQAAKDAKEQAEEQSRKDLDAHLQPPTDEDEEEELDEEEEPQG